MKLRFIWIGKTKSAPIRELVKEYLERLGRFGRVEVSEIRDRSDAGTDPRVIIDKEGREILLRAKADPAVLVLDERGRQLDSIKLAELLERYRLSGTRQITFVIGGHNGVSDAVKQRADMVLALSRMTLTHELARVILVEQVYRALTIIHDLPYHK